MISQKMVDALNAQVKAELHSAYVYLAMAAYMESIDLRGFSHWMKVQAEEELEHAERIYEHIVDRKGRARLAAIEEPPFEWGSSLDAVKAAYDHEVKITGKIHALVNLSVAENDHATYNMLQWFVKEQVEEEDSVDQIVQKLKLAGSQGVGLLLIDAELAQRKAD